VLFVLAVAVPLLAGAWRVALLIDFTLIGDLVTFVVKSVVGRPRPTLEQVLVYGHDVNPSFPSGHVVQYVVFFGILAYLSWEVIYSSRGAWRLLGGALFAVCIALIGLVGPSRVYLGAHWPTDVIGGYLIGAGLLLVLIAADRRWLRPRRL
jgi:undecaprenyl-diphosphatase